MNSPFSGPESHPSKERVKPQDSIISFRTAKGSEYSYDESGKTTRFKTATNEQQERQDITVFAFLNTEQQQDIVEAYRSKHLKEKTKVYVVERQLDDSPKVIREVGEVHNPDNLYLAIFRDGQMTQSTPASLFPQEGANVFDTRHYDIEGEWYTERHLGNKVTQINYRTDQQTGS